MQLQILTSTAAVGNVRHYSAAAQSQLRELLGKQLEGIKEAGTFKAERIITSSQSTQITVQGSDQKILNFCANNYLGLAVSESSSASLDKCLKCLPNYSE